MLTVAMDAALSIGSVAVLDGTRVLAERETAMRDAHSERLLPAVVGALTDAGTALDAVGRIVCGGGPGSFTSLRIAASIAKGLAVGRQIEMFAVPSLLLTVVGCASARNGGRYLSVLDAMRGESFAACYELLPNEDVEEIEPPAVTATNELGDLAARLNARTIGPGMEIDARPRAAGVAHLWSWLERAGPIDVAAWEPMYGRLAEAQVKWEAAHGRSLGAR
ncbi:MAG TPA: tRNA (adenosine(37)-N6)-threonylcarbamoyltransferase complex dimerization subunit type 1 TsaB [Gemmatimonadaceae bacterium]|nr:tRNA (adenosine(37)-N6)-threonylcarbamoyltransferase complex dimerization subunit type 1 TsaB [Gemmatimonadaceae bacterium]